MDTLRVPKHALIELIDAVSWSQRVDTSITSAIEVIRSCIESDICVVYILNDLQDRLVRICDDATAERLGSYFESMPADEHAHSPWLNRDLSPVCVADHLEHPAWNELDPRFREWFGRNGVVAPIVGNRQHLGAVLLAFETNERRLHPDEYTFLALAGRVIGDMIVRHHTTTRLRKEIANDQQIHLLRLLQTEVSQPLSKALLSAETAVQGTPSVKVLIEELERISANIEKISDQTQAAISERSFNMIASMRTLLRTYRQKWGFKVDLHIRDEWSLTYLPENLKLAVIDIVTIALSDIREGHDSTDVNISLDSDGSTIRLRIQTDAKVSLDRQLPHAQIGQLRERIDQLGGRFQIRTLRNHGTAMEATLPVTGSTDGLETTTVIIADPDDLVREGIAALLRQWNEFRVVRRASDSVSTVAALHDLMPQLALIDLAMPASLATIRYLKTKLPSIRCVAMTSATSDDLVVAAIQSGVDGCISKNSEAATLRDDLNAIMSGHTVLPAEFSNPVLQHDIVTLNQRFNTTRNLSAREVDVLRYLAQGFSNSDIAHALNLSTSTVKKHVSEIMAKLELNNRVEVAVYAVRTGLAT